MNAGLMAASKDAAPESSRSRARARLQTAPAPGPPRVEPPLGNQAVQRFLKTARGSAAQDPHDRVDSLSQAPYQLQRKTSCACGGGCLTCQAKSLGLNISQPGDADEIEADQIADAVMRMSADETLPTAKIHSHAAIHRKCDACEYEEEKNPRKALRTGEGGLTPHGPEHVQSAISSGGNPLDRAIRNFFEPRLGSDLSAVRIHTGGAAAESAKAISAKAYTFGSNIVFRGGEYKPDSEAGKHLLAHELAHVSQSSSTATRRHTIYRQTDEGQILTEIQMLRMNLMAPVNPLAEMQRARLIELEAMLGQAAGKPAPPSNPSPLLDLPFSARFAQAWTEAKEATRRKVFQEDKESGSSITRGLIKIDDLVPTPSDVWKTGIYARLFKNDEWDRVEEYSLYMASESFEKRYDAAKYGQAYGEEDKVSGERSNTDADIWSRGRRYGLFLPSEKAAVLRISATGISRAVWLNYMAKTVDLNSPDAVALRDEIHRFADDPGVVLLGPEMERLFGPYEYKYRDEPNRWFAADMINDAYKKSLGAGQILGNPNASLQQRWTECLRIGNFKENNLERAAFNPKCFQSPAEFYKEYYRRMGELERRKVDECPSSGPDKYTCQDKIDLEYYPRGTAQKDYAMRQAYQQYQEHVESVESGGAFATLGRLGGYVAAKAAGRGDDEALRWSEGGAAIGSFGDAFLTVKAVAVARTGFQNYNEGGGLSVSRDVPMTTPPQNVASPPTNEPIPPPVDTATPPSTAATDPWAGSVTRPAAGADTPNALQDWSPDIRAKIKEQGIPDITERRAAVAKAAEDAKAAEAAKQAEIQAAAQNAQPIVAAAGGSSSGGGPVRVGSVRGAPGGGGGGSTIRVVPPPRPPLEPVFEPGAPRTPAAVTKTLKDAGLSDLQIAAFGGENASRLGTKSADLVATLGETFAADDLKSLGEFLAATGAVLDKETAEQLVKIVPRGEMSKTIFGIDIGEFHAAETGQLPEIGEGTGLNIVQPRQRTSGGLAPLWRIAEERLGPILEEKFGPGWQRSPRQRPKGAAKGETLGSTVPEYYNKQLRQSFEVKRLNLEELGIGPTGELRSGPTPASNEAISRARRQVEGRVWIHPAGTEQNIVFNVTGQGVKNVQDVGAQLRTVLQENNIYYDSVWVQDGNVLTKIE